MDMIHSYTLLGALILGGFGVVAAGVSMIRGGRSPAEGRWSRAGSVCGVAAAALGTISALVHLLHGHSGDVQAPMSFVELILHHKAYWFVALLVLVTFVGSVIHSRKLRGAARGRGGASRRQ